MTCIVLLTFVLLVRIPPFLEGLCLPCTLIRTISRAMTCFLQGERDLEQGGKRQSGVQGQTHAKPEEAPCVDKRREGSTYGQVRLPNLKVEASLRSQQPREAHDITIITQCSLDRRAAATSRIN